MTNLFDLKYDKNYQVGSDFFDKGTKERLFLRKSYSKENNKDYYFLNLYETSPFGDEMCQGYMYFTMNPTTKESMFIGAYVKPEYRDNGYASFLISNWIKLCLDNGIYNLHTSKKQRKPFTLHLLKKYEFDLANLEEYETSPYVIHICRDKSTRFKYLMFDSEKQKEGFVAGKIIKGDNYRIIDCMTDAFEEIDKVLLSRPHLLKDENSAYTKSLAFIKSKIENK